MVKRNKITKKPMRKTRAKRSDELKDEELEQASGGSFNPAFMAIEEKLFGSKVSTVKPGQSEIITETLMPNGKVSSNIDVITASQGFDSIWSGEASAVDKGNNEY